MTLAGNAEEDELRWDDKGGLREQDVPAPCPSHSYPPESQASGLMHIPGLHMGLRTSSAPSSGVEDVCVIGIHIVGGGVCYGQVR